MRLSRVGETRLPVRTSELQRPCPAVPPDTCRLAAVLDLLRFPRLTLPARTRSFSGAPRLERH